jgi:hypothetical protein
MFHCLESEVLGSLIGLKYTSRVIVGFVFFSSSSHFKKSILNDFFSLVVYLYICIEVATTSGFESFLAPIQSSDFSPQLPQF